MHKSIRVVVALAAVAVVVLPRSAAAADPHWRPALDGALDEWKGPPLVDRGGVKAWFGSESNRLYFALQVPKRLREGPFGVTLRLPGLKSQPVRSVWQGMTSDDDSEPPPCKDPKEAFRRPCRFIPKLGTLSSRTFRLVLQGGAWQVRASSALAEEAGFQGCCDQSSAAGQEQEDGSLVLEVAIAAEDLPPTSAVALSAIPFEVRVGKVRLAGVGRLSTPLPWGPERGLAVALRSSKVPLLIDPLSSARHACWVDPTPLNGPNPSFECYQPREVRLPSPSASIGVQWFSLPCQESISGDPPCLGVLEIWDWSKKTDRHHEVRFPEPVFVKGPGAVCLGAGEEISGDCLGAGCGDTESIKLWAGCVDAKGAWTTAGYEAPARSVAVQARSDGIHFYVEPRSEDQSEEQAPARHLVIRAKLPARLEGVDGGTPE